MLSPHDTVGEGIMSVRAAFVRPSVRSFVRTDLVTTISHEQLEQMSIKLTGNIDYPLLMT